MKKKSKSSLDLEKIWILKEKRKRKKDDLRSLLESPRDNDLMNALYPKLENRICGIVAIRKRMRENDNLLNLANAWLFLVLVTVQENDF